MIAGPPSLSADSIRDIQPAASSESSSTTASQSDYGRLTDIQTMLAQMSSASGGGGTASPSMAGGGGRSVSGGAPVGGMCAQRRRRASMQDALDYTKINASLYETTTLVSGRIPHSNVAQLSTFLSTGALWL